MTRRRFSTGRSRVPRYAFTRTASSKGWLSKTSSCSSPRRPQAMASAGGRAVDDGACGYFPAVSVFRGGCVQMNFGPTWECPPHDLQFAEPENVPDAASETRRCRPVSERYNEEIAEDVTYDIIDEVDVWSSPAPNLPGVAQAASAGTGQEDRRVLLTENAEEMEIQQPEDQLVDPSAVQPLAEQTSPDSKPVMSTEEGMNMLLDSVRND